MDLAIVIPVFNEADNIAPLVDEIVGHLDGQTVYEIIVVDDGSTDDTPAQLAGLRKRTAHLRVIRHRRRYGQSAAIASGVEAAAADWIVTLDGDGQNDPADILRLYRELTCPGGDVRLVTGLRRRRRDTLIRRFSSATANAVRARVLSDRTPDSGCGLKAFSRATFMRLPRFNHMHRFLPALVQRQGGRVVSVEVHHRARARGRSKYGVHNRLWTGLVDMLGVWWLQRRSVRPQIEEEER